MCGSPGPQRVSCPMLASRFLRRSGSEESIQWEDRPSGASAPSLTRHPMPFRITQESYRPRVSDRTMVGALPTRSACKFQEPNGVDNESCHETIGMGTTRPALHRQKAVQTSGNSRGGLDGREILPHPAEGEKCLLTSPSIGLPRMRLPGSLGCPLLRNGRLSSCAGINRHVVGDARAPQERRKRLHPDL